MFATRQSSARYRPCLLLATGNLGHAPATMIRLRRMGWDIYQARLGPEVRRLSRMLEPDLIVLDTALEGESGWLTCAKLKQERPGAEVILITGEDSPRHRLLAGFVGASVLIPRQHNLVSLLHARRLMLRARSLVEAA